MDKIGYRKDIEKCHVFSEYHCVILCFKSCVCVNVQFVMYSVDLDSCKIYKVLNKF